MTTLAGNTGLEPILPQSKCGVLPLHKFPVCCLSFQAAIPYWGPSYSPTWGPPRYPCGFRGVTLSSGAFLCGARCLLHIRKLETHAGTDIRESNPTHRVLETPSPPWNICPHICPADIPAGAERSPSCYLRAAAYRRRGAMCQPNTPLQYNYIMTGKGCQELFAFIGKNPTYSSIEMSKAAASATSFLSVGERCPAS